ncbi:MAG: sulfurtransferase TusA family protein, partial [Desulfovibrio sp.]
METITPDVIVDCRGLSCPMPMLKLKKALDKMEPGQVLHMMGTDPGTKNDIQTGCKKSNAELLDMVDEADCTNYYIK